MRDLLPEDARLQRALGRDLLEQAALFGYSLVRPPPFELAEVLERGLGALDPADVIRFVEPDSGEVAALRPDMTPQIARMIATRLRDRPPPHRLAYEGTVLRRRGGRAHPRRQIAQVGVELAGAGGLAGDLELLEVLAASLRGAGLADFKIDVGDSGIVRGLLANAEESAQHAISSALAQRDEAVACEIAREHGIDAGRVIELLRLGSDDAAIAEGRRITAGTPAAAALERLAALSAAAKERGLASVMNVDLGEVRGFAYYTSTLVHVYAKGPGYAIVGGGRYDDLLGRFGVPMPAVGFAIDLDALAQALRAAGVSPPADRRAITDKPELAKKLRDGRIACALHGDPATLEAHARAWGYTVVRTESDAARLLESAK
jgi:ATP phosphoribosyltransferase regulatory subunit